MVKLVTTSVYCHATETVPVAAAVLVTVQLPQMPTAVFPKGTSYRATRGPCTPKPVNISGYENGPPPNCVQFVPGPEQTTVEAGGHETVCPL